MKLLSGAEQAAIHEEMARLLRVELDILRGAVAVSIGKDPGKLIAKHVPDVPLAGSPLMHYAARNYDGDVYRTQAVALNRELRTRLAE